VPSNERLRSIRIKVSANARNPRRRRVRAREGASAPRHRGGLNGA
jgi:hypothetical protein